MDQTLGKIKSTICSCVVSTPEELQLEAKIILVSSTSIIEEGALDVIVKEVNK
nr:hypothetical protein [uncultured Draconibacterium sp.]